MSTAENAIQRESQPLERQALGWLLDQYPNAALLKVDTQRDRLLGYREDGPWVIVKFLDGADVREFAIWKATGAVFRVDSNGAVEDDPMYDAYEVRNAERLLGHKIGD
jgi:hypothetical protein